MRRTRHDARELAALYRIPLDRDFHALDTDTDAVESITAAADYRRYRKPRNANGSRARYFHAHLCRLASRPED